MIPLFGDFSVLSPQGLWLLAALAIPILIHLFSRSKGKHVLIGNIELVRQARKERAREVRLSQWLLLLLRLLIVAVLTLLLASLVRQGLDDRSENTAYVTPQWLLASSAQEREALLTENPENTYLLADGLPEINAETLESWTSQAELSGEATAWAYLSESLATINHQGDVTVFATMRAGDWPTAKLNLPREVNWRLIEGYSQYSSESIVSLVVFDRDRAGDARRMELALAVLQEHRFPNLSWSSVTTEEFRDALELPDWMIWLSEQAIAPELESPVGTPITILTDQALSPGQAPVRLMGASQFAGAGFSVRAVHSDLDLAGASVIWESDDGRPLLTEIRTGAVRTLNFASRFNDDWTDLQLQAEFPGILLRILQGEAEQYAAYPANIESSRAVESDLEMGEIHLPSRSMQFLLAMLLTVLWVAERWLSEKQRHA